MMTSHGLKAPIVRAATASESWKGGLAINVASWLVKPPVSENLAEVHTKHTGGVDKREDTLRKEN